MMSLNLNGRLQLGTTRPTQLPWLPVLVTTAPLAYQMPPVLAEQNVTYTPAVKCSVSIISVQFDVDGGHLRPARRAARRRSVQHHSHSVISRRPKRPIHLFRRSLPRRHHPPSAPRLRRRQRHPGDCGLRDKSGTQGPSGRQNVQPGCPWSGALQRFCPRLWRRLATNKATPRGQLGRLSHAIHATTYYTSGGKAA